MISPIYEGGGTNPASPMARISTGVTGVATEVDHGWRTRTWLKLVGIPPIRVRLGDQDFGRERVKG